MLYAGRPCIRRRYCTSQVHLHQQDALHEPAAPHEPARCMSHAKEEVSLHEPDPCMR